MTNQNERIRIAVTKKVKGLISEGLSREQIAEEIGDEELASQAIAILNDTGEIRWNRERREFQIAA